MSGTARYSASLFADKQSGEGGSAGSTQADSTDDGEQKDAVAHDVDDAVELMAKHRPIKHRGSHVDSILKAGIDNAAGEKISTIAALESIDGVHYFKSLVPEKPYGVFLPDVEQSTESVHGSARSAARTIA
ncbi:hypothetical protein [Burkholderia sp. LMG 32019]|uniref:hypothetical protein n=1 Tax=Burkholderia sp. LMG 32019 TaxID=3158173 RepID=UPI003C2DACA6